MVLFVLVCVIWGATWVALKAGLATVPPMFFAGTRFTTAGAVLLGGLRLRGGAIGVARGDRARFAVVSLLMISVTYALLFWGTTFISSGLSAVLDLAFMPVALLSLGVLFGEDRFTPARAAGVVVGVAGLGLLFAPALWSGRGGQGPMQLIGGAAIVVSALVYAWGSVLARPLLRRYSPLHLSGVTMLGGGAVLLAAALGFEPGARHAARGDWGGTTWAAWGFLVLFGSLIAYTAYLELVRVWGTTRTGAYAFLSPIVAVALGVAVLHESVSPSGAIGMVVMLVGAWLTLRPVRDPPGDVSA